MSEVATSKIMIEHELAIHLNHASEGNGKSPA